MARRRKDDAYRARLLRVVGNRRKGQRPLGGVAKGGDAGTTKSMVCVNSRG